MATPRRRPVAAWLATAGSIGTIAVVAVLVLAPVATVQAQGSAADGEQLYQANCATCHGSSAEGIGDAPALGGVVTELGRDRVAATIQQGRGGMPAFDDRLTDEQVADVVSYLDTLPPAEDARDRSRGPATRMRDHMMWDGMAGAGWLWTLLWATLGIGLLVLVVLAVVRLTRGGGSGAGSTESSARAAAPGSAREALDLRYARGEISREEYVQARRDLEGPPE